MLEHATSGENSSQEEDKQKSPVPWQLVNHGNHMVIIGSGESRSERVDRQHWQLVELRIEAIKSVVKMEAAACEPPLHPKPKPLPLPLLMLKGT